MREEGEDGRGREGGRKDENMKEEIFKNEENIVKHEIQ